MLDPRLKAIWKATHRDFKGGKLRDGSARIMPPMAMYDLTCSMTLSSFSETEIEALVALKNLKHWSRSVCAESPEAALEAVREKCPDALAVEPTGVFQVDGMGTVTQPHRVPQGQQRYLLVFPRRAFG